MTKEEKLHNKAMVAASGHYLTERLPEDYLKQIDDNEEEFDEWVSEHLWEPFQYWEVDDVFSEINSMADTILRFMKENK